MSSINKGRHVTVKVATMTTGFVTSILSSTVTINMVTNVDATSLFQSIPVPHTDDDLEKFKKSEDTPLKNKLTYCMANNDMSLHVFENNFETDVRKSIQNLLQASGKIRNYSKDPTKDPDYYLDNAKLEKHDKGREFLENEKKRTDRDRNPVIIVPELSGSTLYQREKLAKYTESVDLGKSDSEFPNPFFTRQDDDENMGIFLLKMLFTNAGEKYMNYPRKMENSKSSNLTVFAETTGCDSMNPDDNYACTRRAESQPRSWNVIRKMLIEKKNYRRDEIGFQPYNWLEGTTYHENQGKTFDSLKKLIEKMYNRCNNKKVILLGYSLGGNTQLHFFKYLSKTLNTVTSQTEAQNWIHKYIEKSVLLGPVLGGSSAVSVAQIFGWPKNDVKSFAFEKLGIVINTVWPLNWNNKTVFDFLKDQKRRRLGKLRRLSSNRPSRRFNNPTDIELGEDVQEYQIKMIDKSSKVFDKLNLGTQNSDVNKLKPVMDIHTNLNHLREVQYSSEVLKAIQLQTYEELHNLKKIDEEMKFYKESKIDFAPKRRPLKRAPKMMLLNIKNENKAILDKFFQVAVSIAQLQIQAATSQSTSLLGPQIRLLILQTMQNMYAHSSPICLSEYGQRIFGVSKNDLDSDSHNTQNLLSDPIFQLPNMKVIEYEKLEYDSNKRSLNLDSTVSRLSKRRRTLEVLQSSDSESETFSTRIVSDYESSNDVHSTSVASTSMPATSNELYTMKTVSDTDISGYYSPLKIYDDNGKLTETSKQDALDLALEQCCHQQVIFGNECGYTMIRNEETSLCEKIDITREKYNLSIEPNDANNVSVPLPQQFHVIQSNTEDTRVTVSESEDREDFHKLKGDDTIVTDYVREDMQILFNKLDNHSTKSDGNNLNVPDMLHIVGDANDPDSKIPHAGGNGLTKNQVVIEKIRQLVIV